MAAQIHSTIFLSLGGTDVSSYVKSASLTPGVATQDSTTMGDAWTEQLGGLKSWSMSVEFVQDFATGALDSILWALHGVNTAVIYRANSAAVSVNNPQYTGAAILSYDQIVGGTVGDLAMASITLTGNGALARATA